MQYFPGNKTSRFTVKLPEILHLNGQWEVALCEIGLPKLNHNQRSYLFAVKYVMNQLSVKSGYPYSEW